LFQHGAGVVANGDICFFFLFGAVAAHIGKLGICFSVIRSIM
jgi:hypothetical protein